MTHRPLAALAAALVFALPISAIRAQGTPTPDAPRQAAIGELDCRTLLRLGGEERDFTILYLHGFVSGPLETEAMIAEIRAALAPRFTGKLGGPAAG